MGSFFGQQFCCSSVFCHCSSSSSSNRNFASNASRFLAEADESSHNVSFNSLMHQCCSELSFKVKQLEVRIIFKFCTCTRVLTYALQGELRQERDLVSSLRSERLSFLANIDNMNSMLDVSRKLSRSVVVLPCGFQSLLLFLHLTCFVVDKCSHHLVN